MSGAGVRSVAALAGVLLVGVTAAAAEAGGDSTEAEAGLTGWEEVPAISSDGDGDFDVRMSVDDDKIRYELDYEGLSSAVTQAHIHVGQSGVSGGISVFLCSNLGNGPVGTPPCPAEGEVSGTLTAAGVVGPTAQGIAAGELDELVAAVEAGVAYANVHSVTYPGGEIRGQLEEDDD